MANVKKGVIVRPPQWWKHLREWKRIHNKKNRKAWKKEINTRMKD